MTTRVETYVARKRFKVGDRIVEPGDSVPEAENWRRAQSWVASGHLAVEFRDADETPIPSGVDGDEIGGLEGLPVSDLRDIAKERGLTGYSKLRKDDLVALLSG